MTKTYVATYQTRGEQTMLIHNCSTAEEARAKLRAWDETGGDPDVEPIGNEIKDRFVRSAKITLDKPR